MTSTAPAPTADLNAFADTSNRDPAAAALLEPTTVAGLQLQSRFVLAPMTRFRSPGGIPTDEVAAYYRRRAASGVGLIITEGVHPDHPSAGDHDAVPRLAERSRAGWHRVVRDVHQAGGRIFAQLWHLGSERRPVDGLPAWTPSGFGANAEPHAMTVDEIGTIVEVMAEAGRIAYEVGFDGVEVHAAHGYLIDEFLWPGTNHRRDAYGGTPAARARFAAEIVGSVRARTSADFPIALRFSQFKERDFGARIAETPQELGALLEPIVAAGVDLLHASQRRFWEPAFEGDAINLAGWAKRLTGLPAITVGSVGLTRSGLLDDTAPGSLIELARRHRDGEFDLVAIGRALLSNPELVDLLGDGRYESMRDFRKEHEDVYH